MKLKKRLVESLEMQISAPDPGYSIVAENMISAWSSLPYPELSLILVNLKYLAQVHQAHHWTAIGDTFYGDHLLFERLYDVVNEEIDSVAEKVIGLGCIENVNLPLQLQQICQLAQAYGTATTIPQQSDLARRSHCAEIGLLRCIKHCVESMKEKGTLTRGLDNLLAGIEDTHEGHIYLLKQRIQKDIM